MTDGPKTLIGRTVRRLRRRARLSQEALAELADPHWTDLGGIERGERNVSLLNIVRIARALRVRPAVLFSDIR